MGRAGYGRFRGALRSGLQASGGLFIVIPFEYGFLCGLWLGRPEMGSVF